MKIERSVTVAVVETVEAEPPHGYTVDWFDTDEGQAWLDKQPSVTTLEDLLDATPWRAGE